MRYVVPFVFILLLTVETRLFTGLTWLLSIALAIGIFAVIASWLLIEHEHPNGYTRRFRLFVFFAASLAGFSAMFVLYGLLFHVAELFFGRIFGHWPLAIAAVSAGAGAIQAYFGPTIKRVDVHFPDLHPDLDGLRIAQVSDLHVSATITRNYVEKVVKKARAEKPDLVAVTGDLADGEPRWLERDLEPLAELRAPLGTYFVPGNHEYYWDAPVWIERVRKLGFIPLVNDRAILRKGYAKLMVAGVPDPTGPQFVPGHRPDVARVGRPTEDVQFKLLLAHRPGEAPEAAKAGFDLQLSGHTHAGQFFPFNLLMPLAHRHAKGLHSIGERFRIYVNVGTGYWGPPIRFLIPAELTVLTLRRARPTSRFADLSRWFPESTNGS